MKTLLEHLPVIPLTCSCCGARTHGRQWWNRDTGFGTCPACHDRHSIDDTPQGETDREKFFGVRGYHWDVPEGRRVDSVWPRTNKLPDLDEYLEELRGNHLEHCQADITEVICLTLQEWIDFTGELLANREWLHQKGGSVSDARHGRVRQAVLVVRPGETRDKSVGILVDPQGHDYARYVGFYVRRTPGQWLITNPPNLPMLSECQATTLVPGGPRYSLRTLNEIQAAGSIDNWAKRRSPLPAPCS